MLMKKVLWIFAALLVVAVSCKKEDPKPDNQNQEEQKPEDKPQVEAATLTLVSDAIVDLSAESGIYSVKFTTNKAWTAEVVGAAEGSVVLGAAQGEKGENIELKVTYQNIPEDAEEPGRIFQVVIKAEDKTAQVKFFQGLVFVLPEDGYVSVGGGQVSYGIETNLACTVKKYDGADEAFPWAPVTITQEDHLLGITFDVAANGGYDARYCYVKITIPEIQVPAYDENGDPTGETEDYVGRLYVYQEGNSQLVWRHFLEEGFNVGDGATASVAMFGDKLLVCDAVQVYIVNSTTGEFEGILETGDLPVQSITSDDSGNLLLANLGVYGELFDVYAIKADDINLENPVHLIHFVNEYWSGSTGIDKVAAQGDVFENGVVSAMYGGVISYGGASYTLYWEITDGKAEEVYYNEWNPVVNPTTSGWLTIPEQGDDLWLSNRAAFVPAGSSVSDGFFYGGYDGVYNVMYYDGTEWQVAVEGAGDWAGGPQGLHAIEWNGKNILIIAQMGYVWWGDGWGMPAYLWVVDVTNPVEPVVLSKAMYDNALTQIISGGTENSTVDVLPVVDGADLFVYYLDTAQGHLVKVRFPKL